MKLVASAEAPCDNAECHFCASEGTPMVRIYRLWYLLALIVALVPPSLGWLFRPGPNVQVVDMSMAHAGEILFKRDWQVKDSNCPEGDGLGPVFNASSCVACHNQGGPGGGGSIEHNVISFSVRQGKEKPREGVLHARAIREEFRERLSDVHPNLPPTSHGELWGELRNGQGRLQFGGGQ